MAPNWIPDPTMSKQNSKVRVIFSGLQTEQAEFLVCNYVCICIKNRNIFILLQFEIMFIQNFSK